MALRFPANRKRKAVVIKREAGILILSNPEQERQPETKAQEEQGTETPEPEKETGETRPNQRNER